MTRKYSHCLQKECRGGPGRKRSSRPIWKIDGIPTCNPCFERFMESNYLDEHRVIRLSDQQKDFEQNTRGVASRMPLAASQ